MNATIGLCHFSSLIIFNLIKEIFYLHEEITRENVTLSVKTTRWHYSYISSSSSSGSTTKNNERQK